MRSFGHCFFPNWLRVSLWAAQCEGHTLINSKRIDNVTGISSTRAKPVDNTTQKSITIHSHAKTSNIWRRLIQSSLRSHLKDAHHTLKCKKPLKILRISYFRKKHKKHSQDTQTTLNWRANINLHKLSAQISWSYHASWRNILSQGNLCTVL